jgi:hypothetical protein
MSSSSSPTLSFALSPPPLLSPSAIRFNPAAQQHRPFHPRALTHLAAGSELELAPSPSSSRRRLGARAHAGAVQRAARVPLLAPPRHR